MKKTLIVALGTILSVLMMGASASATSFGFKAITSNSGQQVAVASQLRMDVTKTLSGQASFLFTNDVGFTSSIQHIYFDDLDPALLAFQTASITNASGVFFIADVVKRNENPANFPGGELYNFNTSYGFNAAKTENPKANQIENGINYTGEKLEIIFTLNSSAPKAFDDLITALNNGDLRVGLHIQRIIDPNINNSDFSDSFLDTPDTPGTPIPEPATLLLFGMGLAGLAGLSRRQKK
ncbi:MAG: hypothetical protein A2511_06720 [Deltaproteobacteria bacterium RIFOXYD12_FULL_50_9]|nr:MAG: hypothetical protein A2511_06720 [Deltaproteobacteria bacterium RIFOXYD12_FULL_50_9]